MPGSDSRGDTFDVVPAALRGAAGTMDSEAEALAGATASLRRHLSGLGAPWGTDEVGTRFGAAYSPVADKVAANLDALSGGLERIASALVASADAYEEADRLGPTTGSYSRNGGDGSGGRNDREAVGRGRTEDVRTVDDHSRTRTRTRTRTR